MKTAKTSEQRGLFYKPTKLPQHLTRGGVNNAAESRRPDPGAVTALRELIAAHVDTRETLNRKYTSYRLKHMAERILGRYVANGDFIAAMILEGYTWREKEPGSPNVYFLAGFRRLNAKDKPIRRNGFIKITSV